MRVYKALFSILFAVSLMRPTQAIAGENPDALISRALESEINYQMCWGGSGPGGEMPLRFGERGTLSEVLSGDQKSFYLWSDDLLQPIGPRKDKMATFYYGAFSPAGSEAVITRSQTYNTTLQNKMGWVAQEKARFRSSITTKLSFSIPNSCEMNFKPFKEKYAMVDTIINTIQVFMGDVKRSGQAPYPTPLHIVIANFDVDYPRTLVYIPETHEVYGIGLHDAQDYYGDAFIKAGSYPFNLIGYFKADDPYVMKIMKYGIPELVTEAK
ncbi:MAG TPA: hypothetical protein VGH91_10400 [Gammaproteobacteria bacterium]|jgi:hypothetical protein